jgi:hypothetical protein
MSEFNPPHTEQDINYLLSPAAIRDRARKLFECAQDGMTHFEIHLEELDAVAELVCDVTLRTYPTLELPYHSRWGHFQAGGVDRLAALDEQLKEVSLGEKARARLDLVVVSVLLDAGAGPGWRFVETSASGAPREVTRSEGLAVASLKMFLQGAFSSSAGWPCRVDAVGLSGLTLDRLAEGFQVSGENPLVGLEGRLELLQALGRTLENDPERFGTQPPRPGGLWDLLTDKGHRESVSGVELLGHVLRGLGPIWPGRLSLGDTPLGDVWRHPLLGELDSLACLMPFHKLSQWLTYSMIEPIERSGVSVGDVTSLTGLAEYRNGGLLLDRGVLSLRDDALRHQRHQPDAPLIIEWRALTVHLLELLAPRVRALLGKTEEEFPLAKVLEGGTWRAGRETAQERRADGSPPLQLDSDGTVF